MGGPGVISDTDCRALSRCFARGRLVIGRAGFDGCAAPSAAAGSPRACCLSHGVLHAAHHPAAAWAWGTHAPLSPRSLPIQQAAGGKWHARPAYASTTPRDWRTDQAQRLLYDGRHARRRPRASEASERRPAGRRGNSPRSLTNQVQAGSGPEPMRSPHMGHRRCVCVVRALARGQPVSPPGRVWAAPHW